MQTLHDHTHPSSDSAANHPRKTTPPTAATLRSTRTLRTILITMIFGLTLLMGCEPIRAPVEMACNATQQCPASGNWTCDLTANKCVQCTGSTCAVTAGSDVVGDGAGASDSGGAVDTGVTDADGANNSGGAVDTVDANSTPDSADAGDGSDTGDAANLPDVATKS